MKKSIITKTIEFILHKIFPSYMVTQIVFELGLKWRRIKSIRVKNRFKGKKDLLVNIGSGISGKPGWINVDAFDQKGIN